MVRRREVTECKKSEKKSSECALPAQELVLRRLASAIAGGWQVGANLGSGSIIYEKSNLITIGRLNMLCVEAGIWDHRTACLVFVNSVYLIVEATCVVTSQE